MPYAISFGAGPRSIHNRLAGHFYFIQICMESVTRANLFFDHAI